MAIKRIRLAGTLVATSSLLAAVPAVADVPTTPEPVEYSSYQAVKDPGSGSPSYYQPLWYDTDGRHIQAHGGQIVTAEKLGVKADEIVDGTDEAGERVYYWYGEDRSNGYWKSPGVSVYSSTDTFNWKNEGVAMRSVTAKDQLEAPYFDELYDTVDDSGVADAERIDEVFYHLNVDSKDPDGGDQLAAIFERPKVLYNEANDQWVMWWHSDGQVEVGGSSYARSLAAVAVSDSPTGPFRLTGAFRLPNRTNYQACISAAVPGQSRDMTVYRDDDGTAYIIYSSEENRSLYVTRLNEDYTNVEKTTSTDSIGFQYSEDGQFPVLFADGKEGSPVRGTDFEIVRECGMLEAPAAFKFDDRYYIVASGATGWAPNQQTYYTASSLTGAWTRGVVADDAHELVNYQNIPEGGDGRLAVGDSRKTTFGSQSTDVFALDRANGKFVYLGDRWKSGEADSTYVWLPITIGENGKLEMRNPSSEEKWKNGWDASYWDTHGAGPGIWKVVDDGLPESIRSDADFDSELPATVKVEANGRTTEVPVDWNTDSLTAGGTSTLRGTLAASDGYAVGREFTRTINVIASGRHNIARTATVAASSRTDLAATTNDGQIAKGWDDWTSSGYPRNSTLTYSWDGLRSVDQLVVTTYMDGSTATWPDRIAVEYLAPDGTWLAGPAADVTTSTADGAPKVSIDLAEVPPTSSIRLKLTTARNTWQSISEVEIFGWAPGDGSGISGISVNGDPVDDFSPTASTYRDGSHDPATARVTATAGNGASVSVTQPSAERPYAYVEVTNRSEGRDVSKDTFVVLFGTACTGVSSPWKSAGGSTSSFCQGPGGHFEVKDNGGGAWTSTDELGVIARPDALGVGDSIVTTVSSVAAGGNSDPRAGLVVRNALGKGSKGYAVLAISPKGAFMQWDDSGDGYIDSESTAKSIDAAPVQLKLERTAADSVTGFWRPAAGGEWQEVGIAPLRSADAAVDAGVFGSGNNRLGVATFVFDATAVVKAVTPDPEPSETPKPVDPSETPKPVDPSETPKPVDPSETPKPVDPTQTPTPAQPTASPAPTVTPRPTASQAPRPGLPKSGV